MKALQPETVIEFMSQYLLPEVFPIIFDIEKSKGNRIYDARGKRYLLDAFGFIASNPLGYNHPKMFDPEFEKTLLRVARTKPSNSDLYTLEIAQFVQTFVEIAVPKELRHLFFIEGGTLAVENALKTAFDWKVRLNQQRGVSGERGHQVLHFNQAFHGRSGYTLSITSTTDLRKTKFFPKFNWPRVLNPKIRFPLEGENLAAVKQAEAQSLLQIKAAFSTDKDDIAAIIIEPIQGEGGDNHFRPEFHRALRDIADEEQVMLIYDEVQTGLGLTGKMWAYQHFGLVPDIVSFGKKMQVCGIMVGKRVESVENHVFKEASRINSTWGGNLVDMIRAKRYLEIIAEDNLVENAKTVGEILLRGVEDLCETYPEFVSNPRGKGLMCAFDVVSPDKRNTLIIKIRELGAMVLPTGVQGVRLRPSLTFSKAEVAELLGLIDSGIKQTI